MIEERSGFISLICKIVLVLVILAVIAVVIVAFAPDSELGIKILGIIESFCRNEIKIS